MDGRFLRIEMLLDLQVMERPTATHVAVFGLSGVGNWRAEALIRFGVNTLMLMDHDTVGLTNLNRRMGATRSTSGQPKAQIVADRIRDISPDCRLTIWTEKYKAGWREDFFDRSLDYIVGCIGLVSCKLDLIEITFTRGVPTVSSLGIGNKLGPGLFHITDPLKTEGCPLTRVVYRELRARGILHHRVLWSPEESKAAFQRGAPPLGRHSAPGSVARVPPVTGLMLAEEMVLSLAGLHV